MRVCPPLRSGSREINGFGLAAQHYFRKPAIDFQQTLDAQLAMGERIKPPYPSASRRLGEEGKVILLVRVGVDGRVVGASVDQSSGFPRLDAAAVEAVTRWRFVPARRGDEPVDSSVIVPITFALE